MSKPKLYQNTETEENNSLKGTLTCVGLLGLIIIVSWFAAFNLFLSR